VVGVKDLSMEKNDKLEVRGREERYIPVLVLKDRVLFPGTTIIIKLSSEYSKRVEKIIKNDDLIGVFAQKENQEGEISPESFYHTGTIARVINKQLLNEEYFLVVSGLYEIDGVEFRLSEDIYWCKANKRYTEEVTAEALSDMYRKIVSLITLPDIMPQKDKLIAKTNTKKFPLDEEKLSFLLSKVNEFKEEELINTIATLVNKPLSEKQSLLEMDIISRAQKIIEILQYQIRWIKIEEEMFEELRQEAEKRHREAILMEEYQHLQKELGLGSANPDIEKLRKKASNKDMPPHVKEQFEKEIERLGMVPPLHPEYPVIYNYLEWLADFPWGVFTEDNYDISRARKILDDTHWGLKKVKERIIEYLAVLKLNREKNRRNPTILCFVGPPGVGKTSLGSAIAQALNRKFIHMSLGGLRDEAEIRGHRRTYIGAMPGRIVQKLRKVGTMNPVFVLDEIDKIGMDFRGDPSMALLEVLDPQHNHSFYDNFMECEIDLSHVLFIATANTTTTIHPALLDRLEIIEIPGYTMEEKVHIAKNHLIEKSLIKNGLEKGQVEFTTKSIKSIITGWTHEAGVRQLERQISACIRKIITQRIQQNPNVAENGMTQSPLAKITEKDLVKLLGSPIPHPGKYIKEMRPGVAIGLAWTSTGGDILYIEATAYPGKEKLILTGNIGKVMRESAQIAISLVKALEQKIPFSLPIKNKEIHIHVPEGAVPKDGPSAGIAILTALISLALQKPVPQNIAMTGEITLSGYVLPVGGIKEKILAAQRNNIKHVFLPMDNKPQFDELEPLYKKDIKVTFVKHISEVWEKIFGIEKEVSVVSK